MAEGKNGIVDDAVIQSITHEPSRDARDALLSFCESNFIITRAIDVIGSRDRKDTIRGAIEGLKEFIGEEQWAREFPTLRYVDSVIWAIRTDSDARIKQIEEDLPDGQGFYDNLNKEIQKARDFLAVESATKGLTSTTLVHNYIINIEKLYGRSELIEEAIKEHNMAVKVRELGGVDGIIKALLAGRYEGRLAQPNPGHVFDATRSEQVLPGSQEQHP